MTDGRIDYSLRRALDVAAAPMFAHQRGNILELLPGRRRNVCMCDKRKDSILSANLLETNN